MIQRREVYLKRIPTGTMLLLLVALIALQQAAVIPGGDRLARGLQNALHGPWFAVLTWLVIAIHTRVTRSATGYRIAATAWGLALLIALTSEAFQMAGAREARLTDVALDMLGASAAVVWWCAHRGLVGRTLGVMLAAVLMLASLAPLFAALGITAYQHRLAPVLVRFDQAGSRWLVAANSPARAVDGALEITLSAVEWPGLTVSEPIADWRSFRTLVVDVDPRDALTLNVSVRLVDREHVYRSTALEPGRQVVRLDLASMFDVGTERVRNVVIYSTRMHAGQVLRVYEVRLE